MDVDDGVVGVFEFVDFRECGRRFGVEDVFVVNVEVRSFVVVDGIDALDFFVVWKVTCVGEFGVVVVDAWCGF